MIIQFCGLSGSGKTTLANAVKLLLQEQQITAEIVDGDVYRKFICVDLGFSREDRNENIRRLAVVANTFANDGAVAIICAINPYEDIRREIMEKYADVKLVYIDCDMDTLKHRDTKQLYRRAMLPDDHPDKLANLSGVNDSFEVPARADLIIRTSEEDIATSAQKLLAFIMRDIDMEREHITEGLADADAGRTVSTAEFGAD